MSHIKSHVTLDAKGLACPMPIVKTKKIMQTLEAGEVIEVQATDKGSTADMKAWAEKNGHQYLGTIQEVEILMHYIRKSSGEEIVETQHPHIVDNAALEKRLEENEDIIVLDVRESAEYAFNHIPHAISIPLGELEENIAHLNKDSEIYVVCRTGHRSDLAAQKLVEIGYTHVLNVVPGMSQWTGPTTTLNHR